MFEQLFVGGFFAFLLVFCRIGSGFMLLPAFGESYVSPRIRLGVALACSLLVAPIVTLPALPASLITLFVLLFTEILIGLFIGAVCRILISTMHMTGQIIALQSGLATATMFDVNQASQGTAIGNFLSVTVVVLLFALGLHHLMLRGLFESYSLFPAGQMPAIGDAALLATQFMGQTFAMAVKLSAPFLVGGLLLNAGAGVLSRLMPTMQVFFILLPPQILLSFLLLAVMISAGMLSWYMGFFADSMAGFLAR